MSEILHKLIYGGESGSASMKVAFTNVLEDVAKSCSSSSSSPKLTMEVDDID